MNLESPLQTTRSEQVSSVIHLMALLTRIPSSRKAIAWCLVYMIRCSISCWREPEGEIPPNFPLMERRGGSGRRCSSREIAGEETHFRLLSRRRGLMLPGGFSTGTYLQLPLASKQINQMGVEFDLQPKPSVIPTSSASASTSLVRLVRRTTTTTTATRAAPSSRSCRSTCR